MKTIDCPQLGRRAISEFSISGVLAPEPATLADNSAANWVFARNSVPMVRTEWWYHNPSRLWFKIRRDTGTDVVIDVTLAHG